MAARLSLALALTSVVCLADRMPPSDAAHYAATAVEINGDVSVLRDAQPWALVVGDQIKVKETIVTGIDGHALFAIADGSNFEVFPNSKVIFRNNPPNWKDFFDLILGKVRVQVEHLGDQPNPKRVLTPTAVISVRGTIFEITVDGDETTTVQVDEGLVGVEHALLSDGNTAELAAGETIRVYRNEPIARNRVDKGTVAQKILRAVMDAVVVAGRPSSGGGGGIPGGGPGGGGSVGDTAPPDAPPATAPPLPPSLPGAPPSAGPGLPPALP